MTELQAYHAGHYEFPAPTGPTGNWDDAAWIKYINSHGRWTVPIDGDPTETIRREMVAEINAEPGSREALEQEHGQVWDTAQLQDDFRVLGFMAPFVVERKSDKKAGSLMFQHNPRFYFSFTEDNR